MEASLEIQYFLHIYIFQRAVLEIRRLYLNQQNLKKSGLLNCILSNLYEHSVWGKGISPSIGGTPLPRGTLEKIISPLGGGYIPG